MADGLPNITLVQVQAVLGFIAALAAALAAPVFGFFARPQQRHIDYKMRQLELIEKALAVGQGLSNLQQREVDVSMINTEYLKVISALPEPKQISDDELFGPTSPRFLRVPRNRYISPYFLLWYNLYFNWAFFSVFVAVLTLLTKYVFIARSPIISEGWQDVILYINLPFSIVCLVWARHLAIQSAKRYMQGEGAETPSQPDKKRGGGMA
jgi:hypothetical protein